MRTYKYPAQKDWKKLLKRPIENREHLESIMVDVFNTINKDGDDALVNFTAQFDNVQLSQFKVSEEEIQAATQLVNNDLKQAIRVAHFNIQQFHAAQQDNKQAIETMEGVSCWRTSVGIEKVGLYIPGGTAPLFSTVLMLGIPAKLAGCKQIILCSPPNKEGKIHPAILFAASYVGITEIYKLGGSQAIAAMTLGTAQIPKVHKIFGPGNQYVTAAKQYAQKLGVAIDMPAGPSEVLVVADNYANPNFIAADLLSQAEHGIDSQVILVTYAETLIPLVEQAVQKQLNDLPRKAIAQEALQNSKIFLVKNKQIAIDLINEYAPEHLIVAVEEEDFFIKNIINAGSVFLGNYTPESAGDYASGTNHTLPTNGFAKAYSGVSLDAFVKKITFQKITAEGLQNLGRTIEIMAEAEELIAHKNAVSIRLESLKNQR